ncbi:MAG: hypothetical protein IANPNBLG_00710 [Bryobacteraceae bacterium]|nr:hypothetical protein [Bryobacteraceae bacterium]
MPNSSPLSAPAADLAQHLADPRPMRRGSVGERFMKCSKPNCACATDPDARHGPRYSLTSTVRGKTQSRYLSAEQAEVAREQIEAGKQFQHHVDRYWEVCQQWADQQLDGPPAATTTAEAVKDGSESPGIQPLNALTASMTSFQESSLSSDGIIRKSRENGKPEVPDQRRERNAGKPIWRAVRDWRDEHTW